MKSGKYLIYFVTIIKLQTCHKTFRLRPKRCKSSEHQYSQDVWGFCKPESLGAGVESQKILNFRAYEALKKYWNLLKLSHNLIKSFNNNHEIRL